MPLFFSSSEMMVLELGSKYFLTEYEVKARGEFGAGCFQLSQLGHDGFFIQRFLHEKRIQLRPLLLQRPLVGQQFAAVVKEQIIQSCLLIFIQIES